MNATETARKNTEIAWATHLDTCMDAACSTCKDFSAKIYTTTPVTVVGRWV